MTETVITARGLTKRYRRATVVDAIDFDVAKGEIFGLLGPNGAGKTTTILMMLGLTDVTAGEVRVLGHNPVREPLAVKRRVGYLPDSVGFYDYLTATEPPLVSVSPSIIRMVVVLPAPLGPSRPKISPRRMLRSIESTARVDP